MHINGAVTLPKCACGKGTFWSLSNLTTTLGLAMWAANDMRYQLLNYIPLYHFLKLKLTRFNFAYINTFIFSSQIRHSTTLTSVLYRNCSSLL